MFCPYVRSGFGRYTYINYDENETENGSVIVEVYQNAECLQEKCGVWKNGECNYKN